MDVTAGPIVNISHGIVEIEVLESYNPMAGKLKRFESKGKTKNRISL